MFGSKRWVLVVAALAVACGACRTAPAPAPRPRNVVLVVVDTLRRDALGVYGAAQATPHIDGLAAGGQVFGDALAAFHQTSMSMGALFSGRTPSIETDPVGDVLTWGSTTWCGLARFRGDAPEATCFPTSISTLAETLAAHGYRTIGVSSNMYLYRPSGYDRGFEVWKEIGPNLEGTRTGVERRVRSTQSARVRTADHVHRELERTLSEEKREAPTFLYVHYVDVHDYQQLGRSYGESVAFMDRKIGELFAMLTAHGLLPDATVIFTSDHGERLGEAHALEGTRGHGGNPSFDELLRVPLIVRPAVTVDATRPIRTEQFVSLILAAAGVEPPPLAPDLEEGEVYLSEQHYRTLRRDGWKLTIARAGGPPVLFDLTGDPLERQDVAASHPAVVSRLRARIDELSKQLAAASAATDVLTPDDERRLRSLGYLE